MINFLTFIQNNKKEIFTILFLIFYITFTKKYYPGKMVVKGLPEGDYQVVLVINSSLDMSKGKIISQVGHAIDGLNEVLVNYSGLVKVWRNNGSAKIAVKGTQDDLNRVIMEAKKAGIPYVKIHDAGRTQVQPGSNTIIAVGPATKKSLENITGNLKLY